MSDFSIGSRKISRDGDSFFFIAEIGHNHQGNLDTALDLIETAADNGADAVKFQKRDNRALFTKEFYERPYDNPNSYGDSYGAHREFLEFEEKEYDVLKKKALEKGVEFMSTPFDFQSVDFLDKYDVPAYKIASGDLTNVPLIRYVAKREKPIIISTGASNLEEVKIAYKEILKHHNMVSVLHCTSGYPTEYHDLNMRTIETLKRELPEAIIGYSGHDNGILACSAAYLLGARVFEKHYTLNRSWKGTDHKFSLTPEGLRKQVRDIKRISQMLGDGNKIIQEFEKGARTKMGKAIYTARTLEAGTVLEEKDLVIKSPGMGGLPPYHYDDVIGKKLKSQLSEEQLVLMENLE